MLIYVEIKHSRAPLLVTPGGFFLVVFSHLISEHKPNARMFSRQNAGGKQPRRDLLSRHAGETLVRVWTRGSQLWKTSDQSQSVQTAGERKGHPWCASLWDEEARLLCSRNFSLDEYPSKVLCDQAGSGVLVLTLLTDLEQRRSSCPWPTELFKSQDPNRRIWVISESRGTFCPPVKLFDANVADCYTMANEASINVIAL